MFNSFRKKKQRNMHIRNSAIRKLSLTQPKVKWKKDQGFKIFSFKEDITFNLLQWFSSLCQLFFNFGSFSGFVHWTFWIFVLFVFAFFLFFVLSFICFSSFENKCFLIRFCFQIQNIHNLEISYQYDVASLSGFVD